MTAPRRAPTHAAERSPAVRVARCNSKPRVRETPRTPDPVRVAKRKRDEPRPELQEPDRRLSARVDRLLRGGRGACGRCRGTHRADSPYRCEGSSSRNAWASAVGSWTCRFWSNGRTDGARRPRKPQPLGEFREQTSRPRCRGEFIRPYSPNRPSGNAQSGRLIPEIT